MHEPSLVKGVPLTLRGRGAKLTIRGPAPPAQLGIAGPRAHSCVRSGHRWGPVTADQRAPEGGCREEAPQKPGPVRAVGEGRAWGSGSPAVGPGLSDTVLRFLGQWDTFLLVVNLGIHTCQWPAVHLSPHGDTLRDPQVVCPGPPGSPFSPRVQALHPDLIRPSRAWSSTPRPARGSYPEGGSFLGQGENSSLPRLP